MADQLPTLAQLVEHLFEVRRHPTGRKYSLREVAAATGGDVGYQAIYRLRAGLSDNPTWTTILALCVFFEVSPTYFFPQLAGRAFAPLPPLDQADQGSAQEVG